MKTYKEPETNKVFWELSLKKLYGKYFQDIVWYEGYSYEDIIDKQDLTVIFIENRKHHYQLKTRKNKGRINNHVYFNINYLQGLDYYKSNHPIHFIAFGVPKEQTSVVIKYDEYKIFWKCHLSKTKKSGFGKNRYIKFTAHDLVDCQIDFRIVEL